VTPSSTLGPEPDERGVASADPLAAAQRTLGAWDRFVEAAEQADLAGPTRSHGRSGRELLVIVAAYPDDRGLAGLLEQGRSGAAPGGIDADAADARVLARAGDVDDARAIDALRAARAELARAVGSGRIEELALCPVSSVLGPLPLLTLLHAATYRLAVAALDLVPCGARPDPGLLVDGVGGVVDTFGAVAARQGVEASLAALLPEATWAFGSRQGAWRTVRLEAGDRPPGPAVAATATVVLDVTSGRATDVAGLWRRRELVTHDPAGMLALLPVLEHVPGLPGTATLGMLARYAGGLGRLLGRWPRLGR